MRYINETKYSEREMLNENEQQKIFKKKELNKNKTFLFQLIIQSNRRRGNCSKIFLLLFVVCE
jgi:hypothetical protein